MLDLAKALMHSPRGTYADVIGSPPVRTLRNGVLLSGAVLTTVHYVFAYVAKGMAAPLAFLIALPCSAALTYFLWYALAALFGICGRAFGGKAPFVSVLSAVGLSFMYGFLALLALPFAGTGLGYYLLGAVYFAILAGMCYGASVANRISPLVVFAVFFGFGVVAAFIAALLRITLRFWSGW